MGENSLNFFLEVQLNSFDISFKHGLVKEAQYSHAITT